MSDPLRIETHPHEPTDRAQRDAKIEQLLLLGLDHYFVAQYDQAINVWTRALFLDRSHARARAYIERARSAQAERQRESEALLQDGAAAARRGDRSEARRLLDAAMAQEGASDDVLALLALVERLERSVHVHGSTFEALDTPRLALADPTPGPLSAAAWLTMGAFMLVIVAAGLFARGSMRPEWEWLVERSVSRGAGRVPVSSAASGVDGAPLPVPRRSEGVLARARALASVGKLRDALPLLESIRLTDPEWQDAERLRADIQRQLIALGPLPASPVSPRVPAAQGGLLP